MRDTQDRSRSRADCARSKPSNVRKLTLLDHGATSGYGDFLKSGAARDGWLETCHYYYNRHRHCRCRSVRPVDRRLPAPVSSAGDQPCSSSPHAGTRTSPVQCVSVKRYGYSSSRAWAVRRGRDAENARRCGIAGCTFRQLLGGNAGVCQVAGTAGRSTAFLRQWRRPMVALLCAPL